jgi:hypothetical protein
MCIYIMYMYMKLVLFQPIAHFVVWFLCTCVCVCYYMYLYMYVI